MPIRIERDQPDYRDSGGRRPSDPDPRRRKSGFSLLNLLPLLFLFFSKKPKRLIPFLLIAAVVYFFFLRPGAGSGGANQEASWDYEVEKQFSFGAELSEEEYDKAMVFEPLAMGSGNQLPRRVSLEQYTPQRLHQGRQGSCVGWATAYGARTTSYARATGSNPNTVAFSPSFVYNQIALPGCQGAYMRNALEAMTRIGALPFTEFGYTDRSCRLQPDPYDRQEASKYRIKGYNRLTKGAGNYTPDIDAIKQNLAQGAPVVVGMMVGNTFTRGMIGRDVWSPSQQEYSGYGLGGHAMCVVGYDDTQYGGAFRVMNSWGEQWGNNGFAWIRYRDFANFTKEAYGLYPEGPAKKFDPNRMEVRFGLVDNATQQLIPLIQKNEITFRTQGKVRTGEKFKVAITNSVECYVYVLGMETDGSSYVLFPYTEKHSPYCGITGTRLFPRDFSLVPDALGSTDYMAIIVSKEPLNINTVNQAMNRSSQPSYMQRMIEVLVDDFVPECDFEVNESVYFNCNTAGKNVLGMIIEVDK